MPERALAATPVLRSRLVADADALVEAAAPLVRWEQAPPLDPGERTAWQAVAVAREGLLPGMAAVQSLKLKGVGHGRPDGAVPPSGAPYVDGLARGHQHVGIAEDGSYCLRASATSPVGGILLDRAIKEFQNAERLAAAGCPVIAPLAVFRYDELRAEWGDRRALGAVVSGGPTELPLRVAGLLVSDPGPSPEGRACRALMDAYGPHRADAFAAVAAECGRTLREFHEAGLFRHNGFLTNYLWDPEAARVVLVDLDSSLPLDHCAEPRRALEIVRDVAGGVFTLAMIALLPAVTQRLDPGKMLSARVLERFVDGYFHDLDGPGERATAAFVEQAAPRLEEAHARRAEIIEDPDGDALLRQLWLDRVGGYGTLIRDLVEPFARTALARCHPSAPSSAEMARRAAAFAAGGATTTW